MPNFDGINDFLEMTAEMSYQDILKALFHYETSNVYWVIFSIYVCLYFRLTNKRGGIKWYRSLIVGYLIIYMPRYLFKVVTTRYTPDIASYTSFFTYFGIWCALNICPFDLIFQLCNRFSSRLALTILQAYIEGIEFIRIVYNIDEVFTSDAEVDVKMVYINEFFLLFIPILVQSLDFLIAGDDNRNYLFSIVHVKRFILLTIAIHYLVLASDYIENPPLTFYDLIPIVSMLNVLIRVIDLLYYDFYPFAYIDLIFPSLGTSSSKLQIHNLVIFETRRESNNLQIAFSLALNV